METLDLKQGTPEWHAERLKCFTASEAPAMMGESKYQTRDELLRLKKTGISPEVPPALQRIFDKGHATEASARPIAESIIGAELYPVTGKLIIEGLPLLASFDGLTMMEDTSFEHKLYNKDLARCVKEDPQALSPNYYWQLEQQLLVSGAEKAIFVVSDGTEGNFEFLYYDAAPGRAEKLIAGWQQFAKDLDEYEPTEEVVESVAEPVKSLPAVSVQVSGEISIIDNFEAFEVALRDFVDNRLVRKPQTDQDFVNLDSQIKALKVAESALDAAEANMLSQVSTVDAMKRTKDMLHKLARDNRLVAEKLLKAEKDNRRGEILQGGKVAISDHIETINKTFGGKIFLPEIIADFAGAMKGKRTIASLQDAVDTTLANAKIESNQIADKIRLNLESLRTDAKDYEFLFSDAQQLVMKENDDLKNLIAARIAEHKQAEQERLEREQKATTSEEGAPEEVVAAEPVDEEPMQTHSPSKNDPGYQPQLVDSQGSAYGAHASGVIVILSACGSSYPMEISEAQALISDLTAAVNKAKGAA